MKYFLKFTLLISVFFATFFAQYIFALGSGPVVIYQIYGGGGNVSAPYESDFIVLYNNSTSDIDLMGWSLENAAGTQTLPQLGRTVVLSGTISAGGYYLIEITTNTTSGIPISEHVMPDVVFGFTASSGGLGSTNNKVRLVDNNNNIIDFVAYGSSNEALVSGVVVSGGPTAPNPSNTTSLVRVYTSGSNNTDFIIQNIDCGLHSSAVCLLYMTKNVVTFQDYDFSFISSGFVNYGDGATSPTDPIRTGYTFSGWNSDFSNVMGDMIIMAEYTINSYTIDFNTDGGTPIASIIGEYNSAIIAPADPIKTGYVFSGWMPTLPVTMPATNETYIAEWINQYTVTFEDRNNLFISSGFVNNGSNATAPTQPSRTGYTFSGWSTDFSTVISDLTIIAEYNPNAYMVAFDANGGIGVLSDQSFIYDITQNLSLNTFSRTGYIFSGWNTDPNNLGISYADAQSINNLSATSGSVITMYAQRQQRATMTITSSTPGPTNTNFTIDIVFNTGVNNFIAGDIILSTNANAGGFATIIPNLHYRLTINPLNNGPITVTIADTAAQDITFGNDIMGVTDYEVIIADLTAPIITITNPNIDAAQSKIINASTNEGNLFYSIQTSPVCNNTLSFSAYTVALVFSNENNNGTYVCFRAIDLAGNISYQLSDAISGIDTTPPVLTELTAIPTPTNNTTPSYSFSTTEGGTITYGGGCSSIMTTVLSGDNAMTFNPLTGDASATGTLYDLCTITVTDVAGNVTIPLVISSFVIDTVIPTASISYSITGWTNQDVIATLTGASESITILNNSGNYTFTFVENGNFEFIFQDLAGNTGSTIATVNNIDKISPVIIINGSNPLNVYKGSSYIDLGAQRIDNVSGTGNLVGSGIVDTSMLGYYPIIYSAVDEAGNTAILSRIVSVINLPFAGGGSVSSIDYCPGGDFSFSYYDGICLEKIQLVDDINTDQQNNESNVYGTNIQNTLLSICEKNIEYDSAYNFSYQYGITTMSTCKDANMDGILIRSHAAKMIANYAINILNIQPNLNKVCIFNDMINESQEMQHYAILVCQLELMGLEADGKTPSLSFNPNQVLDKAQFATILSRLLYGEVNNGNVECRYCDHVNALLNRNIITITSDLFDPLIRAFAMIILMRSAE